MESPSTGTGSSNDGDRDFLLCNVASPSGAQQGSNSLYEDDTFADPSQGEEDGTLEPGRPQDRLEEFLPAHHPIIVTIGASRRGKSTLISMISRIRNLFHPGRPTKNITILYPHAAWGIVFFRLVQGVYVRVYMGEPDMSAMDEITALRTFRRMILAAENDPSLIVCIRYSWNAYRLHYHQPAYTGVPLEPATSYVPSSSSNVASSSATQNPLPQPPAANQGWEARDVILIDAPPITFRGNGPVEGLQYPDWDQTEEIRQATLYSFLHLFGPRLSPIMLFDRINPTELSLIWDYFGYTPPPLPLQSTQQIPNHLFFAHRYNEHAAWNDDIFGLGQPDVILFQNFLHDFGVPPPANLRQAMQEVFWHPIHEPDITLDSLQALANLSAFERRVADFVMHRLQLQLPPGQRYHGPVMVPERIIGTFQEILDDADQYILPNPEIERFEPPERWDEDNANQDEDMDEEDV